ncbi:MULTISPECIES: hypothetical protein [Paraburkholderia]|jgi:hypothetical protein|uniref:Cytochrome c oxidase subunit 2A n=2 Tax=Paraburkholderia TaxID=1822464 RepID=A0A4R5LD53_9BURK|nr:MULTISPECIES: hypothetical protein [Paraburkholderia]MCP3710297.1 hypothetical protein [Paraburkholderia sp. CNPSo 3274]MCP3720197.1 hypothetical protein [Paraburkholderia sp. CNPSo 3281]TDG06300.1 hypothetical protein E1N52_20500 [Paraburkholderia guartelaensis]CAD6528136.1 hypothetical protein LMG27952_02146 [Paraburkholderia hiiakae]
MIETPVPEQPGERPQHEQVDEIVASGPGGALAVAGIATAIVAALWFIFYFVVFLPRGVIQ